MASILEEKLREAACLGDTEAVQTLLTQNVNVNSQNPVNGWTALHWACKRGNEEITKILIDHGANKQIKSFKGETPSDLCAYPGTLEQLGVQQDELGIKFIPNYIKNPPLNGQVDIGPRLRPKHTDLSSMPTTSLPTTQNDDLVLKVKIHGSTDPDFIEIEIPKWKLTYNNLLKICCEELEVMDCQVERIRKLPNTRLRKDSDVKRLKEYQGLELVLKAPAAGDKSNNCYQSISTSQKLINHHRNPIVKIDVSGSKLFLKSSTQEESEFIEKNQANLENILSYERADRRCARSLATWSSEDKLAKVTRTVKSLNNFGYQDKNGTYLYPEEALFLMETNRLEVTIDGVPLSIQEGYDLLLKHCECDVVKYRVYKKLALLGYRLLRYSELRRRLSKTAKKQDPSTNNSTKSDECNRKRVLEAENEFNPKKIKINPETDQSKGQPGVSNTNVVQSQYILNIFEMLRNTAPREYDCVVTDDIAPQYCIFLPSNKSRCNYDFNLYICEDSILKSQHHNHVTPSIYAICSEGNISFYRFSNTRLPIL